jgi:isopentenyl-diphosphate delta-isomerase
LRDELNVEATLEFVYRFEYQACYGDLGSEHELCHVYLGRLRHDANANGEEIAATRFIPGHDVAAALSQHPERYTPWLKLEWETLTRDHADALSAYSRA